jgi:glyoxylase-like metal-dependent hydrolase (beta-lactamase superfamily II)
MASETKRFNIGEIQCIAVNDGTFTYPAQWFFSNVPQEELEPSLRDRGLSRDQIVSPYSCLLVHARKQKVLIDTGAGALAATTGNLLRNLKYEGISAEEITTVVLTHGHPDHIGGAIDANGKPAFPNARYVMSETEWNFWNSNPDLRGCGLDGHMKEVLISCAQKILPALKERVELLKGEKEVVPGLFAFPTPGHTPGHMAVAVSTLKEQLLYSSDAVLHPLHLEKPEWRNVFDLDENEAALTRRRLFDRAKADDAKVLAYHFPFPSLGHISSAGAAWKWNPQAA